MDKSNESQTIGERIQQIDETRPNLRYRVEGTFNGGRKWSWREDYSTIEEAETAQKELYKFICLHFASEESVVAVRISQVYELITVLSIRPLGSIEPMTDEQASFEARRRWGNTASVFDRAKLPSSNRTDKWVGCPDFWDVNHGHIFGNGATWEKAFEDADRRQATFHNIVKQGVK